MNNDENIEIIFSAIDCYDGSADIHYAEFLAALSEARVLITHDLLADSFDRIDSTGKGHIVHDDLKTFLEKRPVILTLVTCIVTYYFMFSKLDLSTDVRFL
jgi:Ca2+-binding EF-hand superfamily protein